MVSVRTLSAVTLGVALATTAAPARAVPDGAAAAPADVVASVDRVTAQLAAWMTLPPTRAAWTVTLAQLPLELVVRTRDALAAITDRAPAVLALLPAPAIPDLTILATSPVPGAENSGFGWRRHPILRYVKFHKGTDFRADRGTPVYAAGTGVVAFAGVKGGYGKVIFLDHGGGVVTRYAHLSSIDVKVGLAVAGNTRIGRVGSTGRATGPHLHFEVRLDGRAVDPNVAMQVALLQRTDPMAARLAAWSLTPAAQDQKIDRHDPAHGRPGARDRKHGRPERRHAPRRDRNRV
ncbi:MAG: M23 family metallopeptidase [Myxococcales bacterium]|nr:M23 family metallopeptidase [Myxococcales bacterium]